MRKKHYEKNFEDEKNEKFKCAKINELINIILNNLRLNNDFLNLFERFIFRKRGK